MNTIRHNRRRFIGILASTATWGATPWLMRQAAATVTPHAETLTSWHGIALGADAELHIHHPDRSFARQLIQRAITEVRRLEQVFSLYDSGSALVRLNTEGYLDDAPTDLIRLLHAARGFGDMTKGAFDPTVQPLWTLYAKTASAGLAAPDPAALRQALRQVDYRAIALDGRSVHLTRPGMALTLNGIAQGYITDRVTELLRDAGLEHALVDMGEIRGLALNPDDRDWRVGLAGEGSDRTPLRIIDIRNRAVSTSSGASTPLDEAGSMTHLFDPRTGKAQPRYRSVSISASDATTADALSTACSLLDEADIRRLAARLNLQAWILRAGESSLTAIA